MTSKRQRTAADEVDYPSPSRRPDSPLLLLPAPVSHQASPLRQYSTRSADVQTLRDQISILQTKCISEETLQQVLAARDNDSEERLASLDKDWETRMASLNKNWEKRMDSLDKDWQKRMTDRYTDLENNMRVQDSVLRASLQECTSKLQGLAKHLNDKSTHTRLSKLEGEVKTFTEKSLPDPLTASIHLQVESLSKELETHRTATSTMARELQAHKAEASSWANIVKGSTSNNSPHSLEETVSATLREEQQRAFKALNIRVTGKLGGLAEGDPLDAATSLIQQNLALPRGASGIERAWRAGSSEHKVLFIRFKDKGARDRVLRQRPQLRGQGMYLNDDLTPLQYNAMRAQLLQVKQARAQGHYAVYRDGRVIVREHERRPSSSK